MTQYIPPEERAEIAVPRSTLGLDLAAMQSMAADFDDGALPSKPAQVPAKPRGLEALWQAFCSRRAGSIIPPMQSGTPSPLMMLAAGHRGAAHVRHQPDAHHLGYHHE